MKNKFDVQQTDGGLIHYAIDDGDKFIHAATPTSNQTALTVLQHLAELHELFQEADVKPRWAHGFQFLLLGQLIQTRKSK